MKSSLFTIEVSERFDGDFKCKVADEGDLTDAEKAYLACVHSLLDRLERQGIPDDQSEIGKQLISYRSDIAKRLRENASCLNQTEGEFRQQECLRLRDQSLEMFGVYTERCDQLSAIPFSVKSLLDKDGLVRDLEIRTHDVHIPSDKQDFKVEVDRALAVIRVVLTERKGTDARSRLNEYLRALDGIACVGLEGSNPTQIELGRRALAGLRDEFVTREAGHVKNAYVANLGMWALVAISVNVVAYFIVKSLFPDTVLDASRNFFLLATGTAIGTWLSFSLRRVVLSFTDLAVLEEDRLRPAMRIIFMIALTFVVGLLFLTSAVEIVIGGFKSDVANSPSSALLIGALCGIAERAMTSAVVKRADDFAAGVGGRTAS
ncbi:hypothetical protein [Reyranella sp.]|uniref:hypothetical protein n=1 Tax=Reyranella sp. TaxID=1929291 RepID=UPI00403651AA